MGGGQVNDQQDQSPGRLWYVKSYTTGTITVCDADGASAGFIASMWRRGSIFWISGTNAASFTRISDNAGSTLTATPTVAPVAGDALLLSTASASPLVTEVINASSVVAGGNTGVPGAAGTTYSPGPTAQKLLVTVSVTYGTAIAAAPTVNLFTTPDGSAWDTQADAIPLGSVSYAVSVTRQATFLVDAGLAAAYQWSLQVVNNDATNALGAVVVTVQEVDG